MFYYLYTQFLEVCSFLNIFHYLTFRTIGAIITAMIISFLFGERFIKWLKIKQKDGQPIREDGPQSHLITKKGTPTMGGGLMLISMTVSSLLWGNLSNVYFWIILITTLGFGLLGAIDDYTKLTKKNHYGISAKAKLLCQLLLTFFLVFIAHTYAGFTLNIYIPFFKDVSFDLAWGFYLWAACVIVGSSNAVNLTDGLDGLAIVPVMIASICFMIITYLVGNAVFSNYLQVPHVANIGEICVFLGTLIGAGLGFLWFNAPPAKIFMGDTGSLSAGGALGSVAIISKHELVWLIIGGLFVIEAVSVILQVAYFKISGGKRIFLMAPIHHHFEKKGWAEPTIVIRFWIIAAILGLLGLASLKLR